MIRTAYAAQLVSIGVHGIALHKLRSLLTMLGIIFGVAAVIAMLAIGEGARQATLRQIEAYGADTLYVRAAKVIGDQLRDAKRAGSAGLSLADAAHLRAAFPFVLDVAPQATVDEKVVYASREPKATVVGIDPAYHRLTKQLPEAGRLLSQSDVDGARRVAVLGPSVARALFLHERPLGRAVRIGADQFEVVGVLAGRAGAGPAAAEGGVQIRTREVARDVYIPITAALEAFPRIRDAADSEKDPTYHRVREMIVRVGGTELLEPARRAVTKSLSRRHRGRQDFEVIVPLEILEQSRKTQDIFNLVMALIASLSLLVGGIGIMNIMLASVTERTREIGIRRSLGASQQDIMGQFLVEATLISAAGGLLGILGGFAISQSVHLALGWETRITPLSIVLAAGVSCAVGLIFGFFPARHAARMDPITALRYE
ncbi:MAG: ABC transporter permease [Candidatus Wallbacteria bacterium]|nr:ABC transporter permease [Candidatus Wallbacteria bacterium]